MAADRPDLRLSDAERQEALDALSEHVRAGRLDLSEFEERSGTVSTAKFRADLEPAFADLPEPIPSSLRSVQRLPPPPPPVSQPPSRPPATWQRTLSSLAVPLAIVVGVVLVFTVARGAFFLLFLLPIAASMITRGGGRRPGRRRHY